MSIKDPEQARWFATHLLPHEPLLRSWLKRKFPDADNIDDIIQDSFLRTLAERSKSLIRSPKSFLFTVARNLALDHVKSHKVARKVSLVDDESSVVVDASASIPEAVARNQELMILKQAIKELPDQCRRIFVMRNIEGMPVREIAQQLGLSNQTVSNQLCRGLSRCTKYVEKYRREWKGS